MSFTQMSADYWTYRDAQSQLALANKMTKGGKEGKEAREIVEHLAQKQKTINFVVAIICAPVIVMVIAGTCWLMGFLISTYGIMGILFNPITVFIGFIITLCSR